MEKTIEIPEGYEARIEGNKVILEKNESEDEGIRKFIIDCIDELRRANADNAKFNGRCSEAIAYLERQKEQKPAEWSDVEKMHLANAILAAEKEWGVDSYTVKFLESLRPSWKPSEEQILAIVEALKYIPNNKEEWIILENLMDDLKKL